MAESDELNRDVAQAADEASAAPMAQPEGDGGQIKVLKGLEAVRMRPGMYIGDTNEKGLHQLVYEVVDNSIDEALAGFCKNIEVTIGLDNSITVTDDGRGIPTGMHPTEHRPACEVALTVLHAGGKFDKEVYKFSGGLHGVGVSCVNALSKWLVLTIDRDGLRHQMRFSRGKVTEELKVIGEAKGTGTTVQFLPDPDVFEVLEYKWEILSKRLRELAYLNAGVKITLTDVRLANPRSETFHYAGGVSEFVAYISGTKVTRANGPEPLAEEKEEGAGGEVAADKKDGKKEKEKREASKNETVLLTPTVIAFSGELTGFRSDGTGDFLYDIALQYNSAYEESLHSFVNGINTMDGGTHLSGFLTALTRAINNYQKHLEEEAAKKTGKKAPVKSDKKGDKPKEKEIAVTSDDVRKGLVAVVSVKVENPLFESQTKTKLNNPEVNGQVMSETYAKLNAYFEEHPKEAEAIVSHAILSAKTRVAIRETIEKTMGQQKGIAGLVGKLSDCSSRDPRLRELYIVEGDSAGGSAKNGRESTFQAILPIRGKLINALKATEEKLLRNLEIRSLYTAIGAGAGNDIDVSKARYHRIVIMTDADVDGSHIRTLVLTFLYRHLKPLVEAGYVYIARPPLFKVTQGKNEYYVETEDDMNSRLTGLGLDKLSMRLPGGEAMPGDLPAKIIQEVRDCLRLCNNNLPHYGIHAKEFLALRAERGSFPSHLLEIRENGVTSAVYAWSQAEADEIAADATARIQAAREAAAAAKAAEAAEDGGEAPEVQASSAPAVTETEKAAEVQTDEDGNVIAAEAPVQQREEDVVVMKLPEGIALEGLAALLQEQGLSVQTLFASDAPVAELINASTGAVTSVSSLEELCEAVTAQGRRGITIQRYKGLGEMSQEELWETTMNPKTRTMIKVKVEDAAEADRNFELLMGPDVAPRRQFIEDHADEVLNPDI